MRLADYIKARRSTMAPAPDNTKQMAQQAAKLGEMAPPEPNPKSKILNQNLVKQQERANYDSPYQGIGETAQAPNPVEPNPMLRDHIKSYKQHAMKQNKNKFDTKGFA